MINSELAFSPKLPIKKHKRVDENKAHNFRAQGF